MVQQPAIEGMLGFEPDALAGHMTLSPWFPADWNSVSIQNLRIGKHIVNLEVTRYPDQTVYRFDHTGDTLLDIRFMPVFPPGTSLESVRINEQPAKEPTFDPIHGGWMIANFGFRLMHDAEVVIKHHGGVTLLPIVPKPEPGDNSKGFRVMMTEYEDGIYIVLFQGRRASKETFEIWVADGKEPKVDQARIIEKNGNIFTLEVEFMDVETEYTSKMVTFTF
jgi:hypothetical protein